MLAGSEIVKVVDAREELAYPSAQINAKSTFARAWPISLTWVGGKSSRRYVKSVLPSSKVASRRHPVNQEAPLFSPYHQHHYHPPISYTSILEFRPDYGEIFFVRGEEIASEDAGGV